MPVTATGECWRDSSMEETQHSLQNCLNAKPAAILLLHNASLSLRRQAKRRRKGETLMLRALATESGDEKEIMGRIEEAVSCSNGGVSYEGGQEKEKTDGKRQVERRLIFNQRKRRLEKTGMPNRPDILHQCLMLALDSPLNKSGLLQIFVKTSDGKLIRVNPKFRIPRNWKIFQKVFADFLSNDRGVLLRSVEDENSPLLQLLQPPFAKHLPSYEQTKILVLNNDADYIPLEDLLHASHSLHPSVESPLMVVVDAAPSQSKVEILPNKNADVLRWMGEIPSCSPRVVSASQLPATAAVSVNRILNEVEHALGVI